MNSNPGMQRPNACRSPWIGTLLVITMALLAGCATGPAARDQQVVERAQARWDATIARDIETAYTYYSPGYRSGTSLVDFAIEMSQRRVNYTSAEYVSHECDEARCTVKFNVGFRVLAAVPGMPVFDSRQMVDDTWILSGGKWWYLPKK